MSYGMTKAQLIRELQHVDDDEIIYFAHPSHDHWRTVLVTPVSCLETEHAEESAYHRQLTLLRHEYGEDECDMDPEKVKEVLVLRG